jgi:hypothetical protein
MLQDGLLELRIHRLELLERRVLRHCRSSLEYEKYSRK